MSKQHNLRQRKKMRIGEFLELGFIVTAKPNGQLSRQARDAFMDEFVEHAIEANGVLFGGGFSDELWGYVMAAKNRESVTEAQLEAVRAWLSKRPELKDVKAGPLCNY